MDLFETLKSMIGCLYISDLRFEYKDEALKALGKINADIDQKEKVSNYIMGGN